MEAVKFYNLQIDQYNGKNIEICQEYAENIKSHHGKGLLLWGNIGTGKTCVSLAIAEQVQRKRFTVLFMDFRDFLTMDDVTCSDVKNHTDLCIVDNLKLEGIKAQEADNILSLIEERQKNGLPTVYTTKLTIFSMLGETNECLNAIYRHIISNSIALQFTGYNRAK